jgi:hypothetical protein
VRRTFLIELFSILGLSVILAGMAYLGGHTGPVYNGARTLGEAVRIGVEFASVFSVIALVNALIRAPRYVVKAWRRRSGRPLNLH